MIHYQTFDTLNHDILIQIQSSIGIKGLIKCFTLYITNRTSVVLINRHKSPPVQNHSRSTSELCHQGSVLIRLLFNIYLLPIFDIFKQSPSYCAERLSACITSLHSWFNHNSLRLWTHSQKQLLTTSSTLFKTNYSTLACTL